MTITQDRAKLISIFETIISRDERTTWLDDIFYSGIEDHVIEKVRETAKNISQGMEWEYSLGPVIPDAVAIKFLINTAGNELLDSISIRKLLVDRVYKAVSERDIEDFLLHNGISDFTTFADFFVVDYSPRSKSCKAFLDLYGVPKSYSIKNPKIKRQPLITTRTIEELPPLIDFQDDVKNLVQNKIIQHQGRGLVVMPTGSGKTRTVTQSFVELISNGTINQNGILWIAETTELLEQATSTIVKVAERKSQIPLKIWTYWGGHDCEFILEDDENVIEGIVVCGKKQLGERFEDDNLVATYLIDNSSLIIVDEAHRNLDFTHKLNDYIKRMNLDTSLIGISATPFRRDSREDVIISQIFPTNPITPIGDGELDSEELIRTMVEQGILANRIDMSATDLGIAEKDPDNSSQMSITVEIIENLLKSNHESILVFTPDIEWARLCSVMLSLKNQNVNCEYIHGGTPGLVRKIAIRDFRNKKFPVLFNCEILTTGFDSPKIDAVVIVRPSTNPNDPLFLQMVGRGLRGPKFDPEVKSDCTIVHQTW